MEDEDMRLLVAQVLLLFSDHFVMLYTGFFKLRACFFKIKFLIQ